MEDFQIVSQSLSRERLTPSMSHNATCDGGVDPDGLMNILYSTEMRPLSFRDGFHKKFSKGVKSSCSFSL